MTTDARCTGRDDCGCLAHETARPTASERIRAARGHDETAGDPDHNRREPAGGFTLEDVRAGLTSAGVRIEQLRAEAESSGLIEEGRSLIDDELTATLDHLDAAIAALQP